MCLVSVLVRVLANITYTSDVYFQRSVAHNSHATITITITTPDKQTMVNLIKTIDQTGVYYDIPTTTMCANQIAIHQYVLMEFAASYPPLNTQKGRIKTSIVWD